MTKGIVWLLVIGCAVAVAWSLWRARRRMEERQHAEEARAASFLAQAVARPTPAAAAPAPEEKLLFDAAAKAGDAGEPALSIQLYARLIARFPSGTLLAQARAGAETQKRKLATPRAPDTSGPG